ncbi:hypothetical protein CAEBREN_06205 [Caenorhabditis brenneri]|uniref:T-box domain-containing protein n=1 Tax=Caenorhabditis brenneri TaxID=135651 RepID=G0NNR6_CAEBE|nr:hypothetical protein CAEBREN_06205 [Caenorhabditis brenneri]
MYQPPSQEIKQPLDSLTQSPSKTSTELLENFDESGWSRACDKFMLASIDITHLDGTFPASPDENSTGPLTVEFYNRAQSPTHQAEFQQQVPHPQPQQTHHAALPVVMPAPQAPLLQRPQKLVLQSHQMPLPVCQLAPQAIVSAPSTPNVPIAPVFNPVLSPFNLSTMASHTRINGELLSKDLWKQQPQLQQIHQAVLPFAMPAPLVPLQQQPQKLVFQGHQSPLPVIQTAPQATVSAPSTPNVPIAPVFNPVLSPFNPFTMASHTQIYVELFNKDLWKLFHGLLNEMCVTNLGKELFPQLQYKVSGLNKGQQYKFVLWLERTDSYVFDWNHQFKQFERSNKLDVGNAITNPVFINKKTTGQEWEDSLVNFADVNLYNVGNPSRSVFKKNDTESKRKWEQKKTSKLNKPRICVSLNCKYNPVLAVYELANGALIHRGKFQFEETSFIAVSMYRNPVLIAHKTALNKTVSKKKRAGAERMLKEYNEEHSRADSGFPTSSDATPSQPVASQCFGANGSSLSTSSGY